MVFDVLPDSAIVSWITTSSDYYLMILLFELSWLILRGGPNSSSRGLVYVWITFVWLAVFGVMPFLLECCMA